MRRLLLGLSGLAAAAWAVRDVPVAMGAKPRGDRAERMSRSPQFRDGRFHNRARTIQFDQEAGGGLVRELLFGKQQRTPVGEIPVVTPEPPTDDGLFLTWYGHATTLVEIDGARVLFDPVWSDRVSPSQLVGPRRLHPMPQPLSDVPDVDAIVISHDHYDHLDLPTVRELVRTQTAPFVVPLGVGAHLERWKVPADRIIELDWEESAEVAGVRLIATAAQHFSGRGFARDDTLWTSWVVAGPTRKVFYTGDSGYFDGYREIGEAHGPFDATLIQVGAYADGWPDIHMTPEHGVAAHVDLQGGLMVPVHWATFKLALHAWTEPADRVWAEAKARDVALAIPRPGERVDVDAPPTVDPWWQTLA
ncbi:MBL fold metallo-hydrolase [Actinokineospora xionganensis]|uniref:MBL fold metallo-hydrolase n=1 Tax=Actinokineospora xionganensis TaxID=2684470 RepID=A0ABR7L7B3_9PSEU|nr:MBL fold metallo-hydrolase [Actinokineospora xionganensis]MBC6448207.1 MBL fold metallo-hydrolase [Actinokineospora xionganensis]